MPGQETASQPLTPSQKRYRRRYTFVSLATAVPIFTAAYFVVSPLMPDGPRRIDDVLAVAAAFILLQMGMVVAYMYWFAPKDAVMSRQGLLAQVLTIVVSVATLLLPILGGRFIDPTISFAIILALIVVSYVTIWLIWRGADEMMRDFMKDGWLAQYFVVVTALMIYAAGERLGLLSGVTAWGALAFATLVGIPCSYWAAYRRGMNRPPSDD
jgi:hypothetical protein